MGIGHGFTIQDQVATFSSEAIKKLFEGTGEQTYDVDGKTMIFPGILHMLEEKHRETDSEYVQKEIEAYMRVLTCPACGGKRLRPEALNVRLAERSVADIVSIPLDEALRFFESLGQRTKKAKPSKIHRLKADKSTDPLGFTDRERLIVDQVSVEIKRRLRHLLDVGLNYLTLDRSAMSLSGGEAQRVRLAAQLGSELSGVIYILDEPSIGLHQRDNDKLIQTVKRLRDLGNTVIVVEHDQAVMEAADYLLMWVRSRRIWWRDCGC